MRIVTNNPEKCMTCTNALYNEKWGDYKCKISGHYVYGDKSTCDDYKEGTPGTSKGEEDDIH